jgi:phage-related minor tail protein
MSRRTFFSLGFLAGLLSGLTIVCGIQASLNPLAANQAVIRNDAIPLDLQSVNFQSPAQLHKNPIQPNWEERQFNGLTYYIVPLEFPTQN